MTDRFLDLIMPGSLPDLERISGADLEEIYDLSVEHNLFMLVYTRLKRGAGQNASKDLLDFLDRNKTAYLLNVSLSIQQEALENKLIRDLNENGIPALVLKGNVLSREVYEAPNTRTSVDIDLLIRIDDVRAAHRRLQANGFACPEEESVEFWLHRKHHLVYKNPRHKTLVEVHWNFGIPGFFSISSDDIWKKVTYDRNGLPYLQPEMLLVHLFVHNSLHAFRELRLFVDILWAVEKYRDVIDWVDFTRLLKKSGLLKTAFISLYMIRRIWGQRMEPGGAVDRLHAHVRKEFVVPPVLLCRYFDYDVVHKPVYSHHRDQLFIRLTLDRPGAVVWSFMKSVFPAPGDMKSFYKDDRAWKLPVNYVRFAGWRIKEWRKGR